MIGARIIYGMARYRALPEFLANVPRRFATPAAASLVFGVVVIALAWVYLLATSVENAFTYVVDLTGLLFALFYILTALAGIVYYRRRIVRNARDAVSARHPAACRGRVPRLDGGQVDDGSRAAAQNWSMLGVLVVGVILMLISRFVLKSPFYGIRPESAPAVETAQEAAGR